MGAQIGRENLFLWLQLWWLFFLSPVPHPHLYPSHLLFLFLPLLVSPSLAVTVSHLTCLVILFFPSLKLNLSRHHSPHLITNILDNAQSLRASAYIWMCTMLCCNPIKDWAINERRDGRSSVAIVLFTLWPVACLCGQFSNSMPLIIQLVFTRGCVMVHQFIIHW